MSRESLEDLARDPNVRAMVVVFFRFDRQNGFLGVTVGFPLKPHKGGKPAPILVGSTWFNWG